MADKNSPTLFYCKICHYTCSKRSDYDKHLTTTKHKRLTKKSPLAIEYKCECGKIYNHRQSLHKHKKKCISLENKLDILIETNIKILEENKEIKNKLNECSNKTEIHNNFNLHLYLNETCKDALNLNDFISKIDIDKIDLDETLNNGLEYNLKNVFIKNLKNIEQTRRPIQCTDIKRDIIYVKDEDVWQIDNEHEKLNYSIKEVQNKHMRGLNKYDNNFDMDNYLNLVSKVSGDIKIDSLKKTILKETKIIKNN